jgi:DNA-binding CsgD family transcriptional regulator
VVKQAIAVLSDLAGDPVPALRGIANTASIDDAINLIDGLLELSSSSEATPWLRCLLVEFLFVSGRVSDSRLIAKDLRDCPLPKVSRTAVLSDLLAGARLDPVPAIPAARRLIASSFHSPLAGAYPEVEAPGRSEAVAATTVLAEAAWNQGRLEEGLRLAHLAAAQVAAVPSPFWRSYLRFQLASKLVDIGRPAEAAAVADQIDTGDDRSGHPGNEAAFDLISAKSLIHAGNPWALQDVAYGQTLQTARRMGERLFTPILLLQLGIGSAYADDFGSARDYLDECLQLLQRCDTSTELVPLRWLELLMAGVETEPATVAASIERLDRSPEQLLVPMFAQLPGSAAWCARQARRGGARSLLDRIATIASEVQRLNPGLTQLGLAEQHVRGLQTSDPAALAVAATEQEHGWARACAANDLAEMVQRSPAGAVVASSPRRSTKLKGTITDQLGQPLSAREQQVAQLVVEGLTNQQISSRAQCSPHTVNFHIRNIFRKLGIHSRIEIAHYLPHQTPG